MRERVSDLVSKEKECEPEENYTITKNSGYSVSTIYAGPINSSVYYVILFVLLY